MSAHSNARLYCILLGGQKCVKIVGRMCFQSHQSTLKLAWFLKEVFRLQHGIGQRILMFF